MLVSTELMGSRHDSIGYAYKLGSKQSWAD
jgi:hypothetical protein